MRRAAERVAEGYTEVTRGGTHQARLEREAAEAYTRRRLASLDIGDTPLSFGRLDLLANESAARRAWPAEPPMPSSRSTSVASRSPTTTSRRWSSTGARRSPSRSTGPPRSSRWAWPAAATSRPTAGRLIGLDDEVFDADATDGVGLHRGGGGRAARRPRQGTHRPHARHRRHHPGRAGRSDPRRHHRDPRRRAAVPAPARRRSRCTAPPTSSTRTASGSRRRVCCSSVRARSSCATSTRSSRRWARTK